MGIFQDLKMPRCNVGFEFFCDHKIEIEMGIKLSSIMQAIMDLFQA